MTQPPGQAASTPFVSFPEKTDRSYRPNYPFPGEAINRNQAELHDTLGDIKGWLRPEDTLKLYELAYFSAGPILEIGTYCGKSTVVISTALRDSANGQPFYSLDIDGGSLASAQATLAARGLAQYVQLVRGSVHALLRAFGGFTPSFVFIDGDHSLEGVRSDLKALSDRVSIDGVVLFHDYLDDRNDNPDVPGYGVTTAISQSWVAQDCEYAGTFGCAALYRRISAPSTAPPSILDLVRLDPLDVQIRSRVAAPAKELLRRLRSLDRRG
jgi:cephalosporin hydroxylase